MDCREKAKALIDEMHPDDVTTIISFLERFTELRETIETIEDTELLDDIAEGLKEIKQGKVSSLEGT